MDNAVYKLLLITEGEPTDAALWRHRGLFQQQTATPSQAADKLRASNADALVWRAGSFRKDMCRAVQAWKTLCPQTQILVVLDGTPDTGDVVALIHAGCHDVLDGRSPDRLRRAPRLLYERIEFVRRRRLERLHLARSPDSAGLVGESPLMLQIYEQIRQAAGLRSPVLIQGETGTGKGLVARAIHALSARNGKPFVTVDCGCLAPTLIESELYGVTRGAFTGATFDRPGLAQTARDGTLFLDEVGELPLGLQPKLLRLLEEGEVRQVGSARSKPIDVRIISATSRDLDALVNGRRFRLELYYRLNVLQINLPPLREHPRDIPLLANYFTSRHLFRSEPITISGNTMNVLEQYFWPGNVRELKNCIEAAIPTLTRNFIQVHNLPRRVTEAVVAAVPGKREDSVNLRTLASDAIRQALRLAHNDKTRAAKLLGIGKTTLYRKLKGMEAEERREQKARAEGTYLM